MLACRLTSAALVYCAGNVAAPKFTDSPLNAAEEEHFRLHYYQFAMGTNKIRHQFALSAITFDFHSICEDKLMSATKFVYGCLTSQGSFGANLGRSVKIDCLVKIDAETLIKRGLKGLALTPITGCFDERTVKEVLDSTFPGDTVKIFKLPAAQYAQQSQFIARFNSVSEDDGFIMTYVFEESQLDNQFDCLPNAKSELWVIDAKDMKTIVGKVRLLMRVPYGLHGSYFLGKTSAQSETLQDHQRVNKPQEEADSVAMDVCQAKH